MSSARRPIPTSKGRLIRLIPLIAAAALLAVPVARSAPHTSGPSPVVDRALRQAAARWYVPYGEMRRVSFCESRWDPRAVGHGSLGLFQFLPSTFAGTPYRRFSIFNPWANAMAAAWVVRRDGGWSEWTCKP